MTQQIEATNLSAKMRSLADTDGLPQDHELRQKADFLDVVAKGFFGEPQTHNVMQFVGGWARARRAWCNYTGEVLI